MKKLSLILFLVSWVFSGTVGATINQDPDYTFMWNGFNSVTIIDSFAITTTKEGLVVLKYDQVSKNYRELNNTFLNSEPYLQKLSGTVLTVRTIADVLYFIDVGNLPQISILGKVDIDFPFHDFALHNQDLYICAGYDGLFRYSMINYKMAAFADSSRMGIHYTRVEVYDNELYALDDYNGILRYDLTGVGFGKFIDYLYIPFQATSFVKVDSIVVIASKKQKIMLGHFGAEPEVTDTVELILNPTAVFARDSLIIVLDSSQHVTQIINRHNPEFPYISLLEAPDKRFHGDFTVINNRTCLIFPSLNFGLVLYDLAEITTLATPIIGFNRPGPITDMTIYNGSLFTGGSNNPLDKYILSIDGKPTYRTTLYNSMNNISSLYLSGDSLFIYYPKMSDAIVVNIANFPITYEGVIAVSRDNVNNIIFQDRRINNQRPFFAAGKNGFDVYAVSDSNVVTRTASINIIDEVHDFVVQDSIIIVSTNKSSLWLYRLYDNFTVEFRTTIGLPFTANKIQSYNHRLMVFSGSQLIIFDVTNPQKSHLDTSLSITLPVYDCSITGNRMYTVGPFGIQIFDMTGSVPRLLDYGGRKGQVITAYEHIAVISNGYSIHIYDLRDVLTDYEPVVDNLPAEYYLFQNYPNPFNPVTTIEYSLPRRGRVELSVYNILGQKVTTLVDEEKSAGRHTVEWRGTGSDGRSLASGIYLYRLLIEGYTETRKMILIK